MPKRREVVDGKLRCSRCSQYLPLSSFSKKLDFYASRCKPCAAEIQLLIRYNLTLKQYKRMLKKQKGVCKLCKQPDPRYQLAVDHNHACCPGKKSCGKCVRGLLCSNCNNMMGAARDNPKLLRRAAKYIERNNNHGSLC